MKLLPENKSNDFCLDTLSFFVFKYFLFTFVSILMKQQKYLFDWGCSFWLILFWVCYMEFLSIIIASAKRGLVFNLRFYLDYLFLDNNPSNLFCHFVLLQVVKNWIFSHYVDWKAFQCRVFREYFFGFKLVFCSYLFVSLLVFWKTFSEKLSISF